MKNHYNMRIYSIEQLEPIINYVQKQRAFSGLAFMENYRGQGLDSYKLISGIGRYNHKPEKLALKEKKLFDKFVAYVENGKLDLTLNPFNHKAYHYMTEWYQLFQAQHLGLITRQMDWSIEWKISLLFAVDNEQLFGQDGQFWIFKVPRKYIINNGNQTDLFNTHPLEITSSFMVNPPFYVDKNRRFFLGEKRRTRQHGRFWVQPFEKSLIPLEQQPEFQPYLTKFIVDGDSKKRIKKELNDEGYEIDWVYFKNDEDINSQIKYLNDLIMKKCGLRKKNASL